LEGKAIPAGKYALYTIPGESEWTIMIYKDLDLGGNVNDYDETKELTRFTVMSQENANMVESFTINIDDLRNNSATLQLLWGHIMVPIKMTMDTDAMIMASIEDFIENSDEEMINQFAAAANYYLNNEKDLNQALDWINTVVEARPDQFWHYQTKAKILAAKNDFKSAIEVAHQSLELAKKAPNDFGYIQSNESLIDTWTSK